jgi:hypothetical protein
LRQTRIKHPGNDPSQEITLRSKTAFFSAIGGGFGLILMAFAAAQLFSREYAIVLFDRQDSGTQVQTLRLQPPALPGSLRGRTTLLTDCNGLMRSFYVGVLPETDQTELFAACGAYADHTLAETPTSGLAWLIAAQVAALSNDPAAFVTAYENSQQTTPREGWISERRFALLAASPDQLSPAVMPAFTADILLILGSLRGRLLLAQSFSSEPRLREALTVAIAQADPASQRAFLSAVKQSGPITQ